MRRDPTCASGVPHGASVQARSGAKRELRGSGAAGGARPEPSKRSVPNVQHGVSVTGPNVQQELATPRVGSESSRHLGVNPRGEGLKFFGDGEEMI